MIGKLLRELFPALGRFIRYRAGEILRRQERPAAIAEPPPTITNVASESALDPEYMRRVQWPCWRIDTPSAELATDALYKLWKKIPGGHKWSHYFPVYQSIFGSLRDKPLRVLEIGVYHGASLKLWRKYFRHAQTIIVGVDIASDCLEFDAPAVGIHVRIGSQTDAGFLKKIVDEFGPFDLIIDDGSHVSSHIIASFNHLFASGLKDSGIYFVEDLHANYWTPWRDSPKSFLDIGKELIELMHAHYQRTTSADFFIAQASNNPHAALEVPLITTMIQEIRFFDSIVAIQKTLRKHVPHYVFVEE